MYYSGTNLGQDGFNLTIQVHPSLFSRMRIEQGVYLDYGQI